VKKMIIVVVVLVLIAGGAGGFAFMQYSSASQAQAELEKLQEIQQKFDALVKESESQQASIASLIEKAQQFDAVKEALSNGVLLQDLETILKAQQAQTPERILSLGALRLVVKGKNDPSTTEAYDRALQMVDIDNKLASICAAQAGMMAAGKKIELLSECRKRQDATAGSAPAAAPAPAGPANAPAVAPAAQQAPPAAR
jgi:type II secretory pathway pseudopilin PulG